MPSGFDTGPQSCATTKRVAVTDPDRDIHDDVGHHGDVAVVAFVKHAGDTAAADELRRERPVAPATAWSPSRPPRAARETTSRRRGSRRCRSRNSTGSAFTCAAISSRNDSCAKVFCRREGDRSGPVKNGDAIVWVSTRSAVTVPVPPARPADPSRHVRRRRVASVVERRRHAAGTARSDPLRLEACEHAGDDVARSLVPGPAAQRGGPRLHSPTRRYVRFASIATRWSITYGDAVVLPRHLVLSGQLHAHRSSHRLRQQRRIIRRRCRRR